MVSARRNLRAWRRLLLLGLAALGSTLTACGGQDSNGGPQMPPADVSVSQVVAHEVTEWDEFSGRIEAVEHIEIRPRVSGYLAAVHFREGSEVRKGALLFSIDDREFRAAVDSAQANVARAQTRVEVAQAEWNRTHKLAAAKAASTEELEQRGGELQQAKADLKASQAQAQMAELNLQFTRISAPIAGRVGAAMIRPGNLLAAGSSVLTSVVSLDPVHVVFEGDEQVYLRYQKLARDGLRPSSRDAANPVRVGLANETGFPHEGVMDFVDNALDPDSGTIRARAVLDNADRVFTPGLFARVQLRGNAGYPALLIHEQAVLTDQDRKYVYVVGQGNTAQRKDVSLGAQVDGLRVVTEGLDASDRVVVNGVRKIFFEGAPLNPQLVPMDAPNQAPAPAAPVAVPAGG